MIGIREVPRTRQEALISALRLNEPPALFSVPPHELHAWFFETTNQNSHVLVAVSMPVGIQLHVSMSSFLSLGINVPK